MSREFHSNKKNNKCKNKSDHLATQERPVRSPWFTSMAGLSFMRAAAFPREVQGAGLPRSDA